MTDAATAANAAYALLDRHIAAANGNRTALKFAGKAYSYNDLAAIANRTGNMLKHEGVTAGAAVLVVVPPSPAQAGTVLGAMKIGAMPVIIAGAIDAGRVAAAAAKTKPALAIVHRDHVEAIAGAGIADDRVVVVGATTEAQRSFVDLIREQPSSLAAASVDGAASAMAVFDGVSLTVHAHRDLPRRLDGPDDGGEAAKGAIALLRSLAKGEEFAIG